MKPMWILLVIIGGAILGWIAFEGIRFAWLVRNSAALVERSRAFERETADGSPRILVMGDSTAVGTGASPEGSVAGRFGAAFPNATIRNVSENGWKIGDVLAAFPRFEPNSFDLVVLQIGANDIIRGTPERHFETSIGTLFDKAKVAGKNVVALHSGNIGLAPMFRWPASSILSARTRRYRDIYKQVATEKGVAYVDLYEEEEDDVMNKDVSKYYASDLLHLTNEGYEHWYEEVRKTMRGTGIKI